MRILEDTGGYWRILEDTGPVLLDGRVLAAVCALVATAIAGLRRSPAATTHAPAPRAPIRTIAIRFQQSGTAPARRSLPSTSNSTCAARVRTWSATRFGELLPTVLPPLIVYQHTQWGTCTGLSCMDSTPTPRRLHADSTPTPRRLHADSTPTPRPWPSARPRASASTAHRPAPRVCPGCGPRQERGWLVLRVHGASGRHRPRPALGPLPDAGQRRGPPAGTTAGQTPVLHALWGSRPHLPGPGRRPAGPPGRASHHQAAHHQAAHHQAAHEPAQPPARPQRDCSCASGRSLRAVSTRARTSARSSIPIIAARSPFS
jgi:hypothetical protein